MEMVDLKNEFDHLYQSTYERVMRARMIYEERLPPHLKTKYVAAQPTSPPPAAKKEGKEEKEEEKVVEEKVIRVEGPDDGHEAGLAAYVAFPSFDQKGKEYARKVRLGITVYGPVYGSVSDLYAAQVRLGITKKDARLLSKKEKEMAARAEKERLFKEGIARKKEEMR